MRPQKKSRVSDGKEIEEMSVTQTRRQPSLDSVPRLCRLQNWPLFCFSLEGWGVGVVVDGVSEGFNH